MGSKRFFTWIPDHDKAFTCVKEALMSPPVLAPFYLALQVDASMEKVTPPPRLWLGTDASASVWLMFLNRCQDSLCQYRTGDVNGRLDYVVVQTILVRFAKFHLDD